MVLSGTLSAGSLILFILYLGKMYTKPMQELSKLTDAYGKATIGYERIKELLETTNEVRDHPGAKRARPLRGELEFRHVTFSYQPNQPILRDLNFKILPGQVAAFVGQTGAGKSTIVSLIPRFYRSHLRPGSLRWESTSRTSNRSLSGSKSVLSCRKPFSSMHRFFRTSPMESRKPRARKFCARRSSPTRMKFIDKMPDGYDTMVGERGVTLSGGQRQRIAIARAVIRNSPILIMDEPKFRTRCSQRKSWVFDALDRLMAGKTSVIVAHRLSTIRKADVIFVLKDGAIVEQGYA